MEEIINFITVLRVSFKTDFNWLYWSVCRKKFNNFKINMEARMLRKILYFLSIVEFCYCDHINQDGG